MDLVIRVFSVMLPGTCDNDVYSPWINSSVWDLLL